MISTVKSTETISGKIKMIPLSVPNLKGNEKKYLDQCVDTEWVSSVGSYVDKFEEEIANYTGSDFSVACTSGTSALHLALKSIGVKPNDEVIVPTMTFIATPNSVVYNQAYPIFMDCDRYLNIDSEKLEEFLTKKTYFQDGNTFNKETRRRIFAIIPVHVSGNAVKLQSIEKLCLERNIKIVEDAAEAMGTRYLIDKYNKKHAGSIGHVGCLSFNGNKIITSGGGGMIITNDKEIADRARYLSTQANDDGLRYLHNDIGFNYRLTNIQAAVGLAQLEQLDKFVEKKKYINAFYKENLNNVGYLSILSAPEYASNNHWMSSIYLEEINDKINVEKLFDHLGKNSIQVRPMWYLCHLQKPYQQSESYFIEKAIEMQKCIINIPCSTNITEAELEKVCKCLKDF